ncbi:WD40 domain-containing protein [Lyngbya aestuarii]|uniref:WD40 domain-containing protein n=1 Tax=Lyngbya aestuarii TaxID=118322 RepID=UPI00403DC532
MSYCINPSCPQPNDPANINNRVCRNCGSDLLIQGHYQVMRLLSDHSGFGKVYEAYSGSTPKVLKVLKQKHNSHPRVIELFKQEAAVLGQLNHPGIPKIDQDGYFQFLPRNPAVPVHCIIMEKIDGLNLKQWMRQQGNNPISQKQALDWLQQLAEILHLVHQKNYFHRDIKPENIMLRSTGQVVLIDFGTARELTYTYLAEVAGAGSVTKISSTGYTPPEQEKGHAVPQSDFYALGRTFVYLLTGKEATDPSIYEPFTDQVNWRNHAPAISVQLANFIDKLMAPTAAARPKNTQEILDEIAQLTKEWSQFTPTNNQGVITRVQSSLTQLSLKIPRNSKQRLQPSNWLIGGVVVLAMGLASYTIWHVYPLDSPYIIAYKNISFAKTLNGHSSYVNYLVISPDGERLVSASADKTIKIWNLATGKEIRTLVKNAKHIDYFGISHDWSNIATVSGDNTIKIWDFATGKEIRTLNGHSSFVNYLAISPDDKKLVSASADNTIKIWNFATGKEIRTLTGHSSSVKPLVISPDGKILVSGSADNTIKIWDFATGKEIHTLIGHSSSVNSLAISPDGRTLISGSADNTIKIWNLTTGKEIRSLTGHSSYINSLVLSPDGKILISGGADNTIKIWNLATGKEIRTLTGHSSYINSLALSPDGKILVSGSADNTIKIWQLPQ